MENKILVEKASFFRNAARKELKGNWIMAVVAIAIFFVILGIVDFIVSVFADNSATRLISGVYYVLIYGPATVGMVAFIMNLVRNKNHNLTNCFEGFESFGRSFVLGLLMLLFVALWSLLLIIPGIIASYRYSMAPMILRDRPELSPIECIRESKRIMTGNKGKKFCIDLSFIGWAILAVIPEGVVAAILELNGIGVDSVLGMVVITICYIPMLWVVAYMQTTTVVFYEELIRPVFRSNGGGFYGNSGAEQYSYQRYEKPETEEKGSDNEGAEIKDNVAESGNEGNDEIIDETDNSENKN